MTRRSSLSVAAFPGCGASRSRNGHGTEQACFGGPRQHLVENKLEELFSMVERFIGCLLRTCQTVWVASEPGFDHIGEEHTTQSSIDWRMEDGRHFAHSDRLVAVIGAP